MRRAPTWSWLTLLLAPLWHAPVTLGDTAAHVFVLLREPPAARSDDLIVRRRSIAAQRQRVLQALPPNGVRLRRALSIVSGFSADVSARGLAALRAHPDVIRVDPMRYGYGALNRSVPHIRADSVHRRDDQGQGVTVAVLDSGVQTTHPDLAGRVVAEECFCSLGCCPDSSGRQSGPGSAFTTHVHGIHVAGILASQGTVAPYGVAPGANLVAVKVVNDDEDNRGSLFDWILALEWILENRLDVQVINMSLASGEVFMDYCDQADSFNMAFAQVIERLRARGVLTFVASGNIAELDRMSSPACVRAAVAVGAVERDDRLAEFTNRSTALDLLAPGTGILSDAPNGGSERLDGTSMATAHAAATAALLAAWHPQLGPDAIEAILKESGTPVHDSLTGMTTPRINALKSFTAMLPASQPFPGGGSGRTDCLIEWHASPVARIRVAPRLRVECRDGDAACDLDAVSGQCTLGLSLCLNEPDPRLPRCASAPRVTSYRLIEPKASSTDPIDQANATAVAAAMPAFPVTDADLCTDPIALVVPSAKPKRVRLRVTASDERSDVDRVELRCQPSP